MERETLEQIRLEAERVHESATYSSETQFEHAKRWRGVDRTLSASGALLAGVSGVGALADTFGLTTAAVLSLAAAGVTGIASALGARQISEQAASSANGYRHLQQDARIFLRIELPSSSASSAQERLVSLVARQQELNRKADIPGSWAWKKAKKNIESGSQMYEVDENGS